MGSELNTAKPLYDEDRLPLRILLGYSVVSIPLSAIILPAFMYVPTFYAQEFSVELSTIGLIIFAARLWDGITDPTIGILSDATTSPIGRRKPWIVAGALVTAIACFLLFTPPKGVNAVYLCITLFLFYAGWTMISIPHGAWGAEITRNYDQRSRLVAFNMSADTFGFFLVGLVPIAIGAQGEDFSGQVLAALALPMALLLPIAASIPVLIVPQGLTSAPATPTNKFDWRFLSDMAKNWPFLRLCLGMISSRIGEGVRTTLSILFVTYYWERTDILGYAIFLVTAGTLVSIPAWLWAARKFEKAKAWRIPLLLAIVVSPLVLIVDSANTPVILGLFLVSGFITGGNTVIPGAMLGDVIDFDSLKSKKLRAGTYLSVWSFGVKLVYAIPVLMVFPVLDMAGFDAKLGADNSEHALLTLGLVYALTPIPFKIIALISIWNFPIGRARHSIIKRRLDKLGIGVRT